VERIACSTNEGERSSLHRNSSIPLGRTNSGLFKFRREESPSIGLSKPAIRSRSISLSGCSIASQSRNSKSNPQALNMFLASSMEVQRWSLYSFSRDRFKSALRVAASSSSLTIASKNSVPRISLIAGGGAFALSLLNGDSDWDIILKREGTESDSD